MDVDADIIVNFVTLDVHHVVRNRLQLFLDVSFPPARGQHAECVLLRDRKVVDKGQQSLAVRAFVECIEDDILAIRESKCTVEHGSNSIFGWLLLAAVAPLV
jgi:hypothetical protein